MTIRRIAVMGAGNGGQALAAHKTLDGFEVSLFELPKFSNSISQLLETKQITIEWIHSKESDEGVNRKEVVKIHNVTTNIEEALKGAEIIFVVTPAFGHKTMANICAPHIVDGQIICLLPGSAGSLEFVEIFKKFHMKKQVIISETSTLPYGTRLVNPSHVAIYVEALSLPTGIFPSMHTDDAIRKLQEVYPTITPASNVLEAAINNPNPIAHPAAALLSATRIDFSKGEFYIYREAMTPSVARVYEALENERLQLLDTLGLKYHHCYGLNPRNYRLGDTLEQMPNLILKTTLDASFGEHSIQPGLRMKGPRSLKDRYITEDVPYGLLLLANVGRLLDIPTPTIDSVIHLLGTINEDDYWAHGRSLNDLGLNNMNPKQLASYLQTGR